MESRQNRRLLTSIAARGRCEGLAGRVSQGWCNVCGREWSGKRQLLKRNHRAHGNAQGTAWRAATGVRLGYGTRELHGRRGRRRYPMAMTAASTGYPTYR